MTEPIDYEARMDNIFAPGRLWKHRTLRTVFDPPSQEYSHTSIEQKIDILKKVVNSGERLGRLISDYKDRYLEQNRRDIALEVEKAIIILLNHKLKEEKQT